MMDLLKETIESLTASGKTPAEVKWVGSKDGAIAGSWADFAAIASVDYDNGYGGQEVAKDLVVVGADWWLERAEYDGSEWWKFKSIPQLGQEPCAFKRVKCERSWASLETCQKDDPYDD
jgi:hypothetical protein